MNNKPIILLDEYEKEIDIEEEQKRELEELKIEEPKEDIECPGDVEIDDWEEPEEIEE